MTAADFGSGSGGWAIPLAKKLEEGRVYAIDILDEPLSALRGKIKTEKISNIEVVRADVEDNSTLADDSCDLVLLTNLLFQVDDKKKALAEAKRVLKKGGKILVVDWKDDVSLGPEKKVLPEEVEKIAGELDLRLDEEFEAGAYHYALIFTK